jgi:hypothetical protein
MKRKDTTLGGSAEECFMPKRSTYEDRPVKRCDIESGVSIGDTSSSNSRVPKD